MNVVLFQHIFDILIIVSLLMTYITYKKEHYDLAKIYLISTLVIVLLKGFVYFNFTNSDHRVKQENINSTKIFQAKMKPIKKINEFNYSKDFKDASVTITKEVDKIRNSIQK